MKKEVGRCEGRGEEGGRGNEGKDGVGGDGRVAVEEDVCGCRGEGVGGDEGGERLGRERGGGVGGEVGGNRNRQNI